MDNLWLVLALSAIVIIQIIICIIVVKNSKKDDSNDYEKEFLLLRQELNESTSKNIKMMADMINQNQQNMSVGQKEKLEQMEQRLKTFSLENEQKLENIRSVVEKRLTYLQ
ncbi:MAG: hypothetical protein ACI4HM_09905 [Ruminococcus sp.]